MSNKVLQIVSFDNPYPPIYGGIVEVYHKLKAIHDLGIEVHFHCFTNQIPHHFSELSTITEKIYFYKTTRDTRNFLSLLPFSVLSRNDSDLLRNLNKINAPILFESIKSTYLVHKNVLPNHRKFLRLHNIEYDYFSGLSKSEANPFKKYLYKSEGIKFANYEKVVSKFEAVFALSLFENNYIKNKFDNSVYVPVFHGNEQVKQLTEHGKFAFYHGDLRMSDNLRAVKTLVAVFRRIPEMKFLIASSNAEQVVKRMIGSVGNIEFVKLESHEQLTHLLNDAHMNVMLSYQKSGTKLKLMTSLFNSRHCVINENISDDPKITNLCHVASSEEEIRAKIIQLKNQPFVDYDKRKNVLEDYLNDKNNAAKLLAEIFGNN